MYDFAYKLGWKMQKMDKAVVEEFYTEIGVWKEVLKVWLHNNKNTLGDGRRQTTTTTTNNNNGGTNGTIKAVAADVGPIFTVFICSLQMAHLLRLVENILNWWW